MNRRTYLKKVVRDASVLATGYVGYEAGLFFGGFENAEHMRYPFYDRQIVGLPQEFDGTLIAHFTDMHISRKGEAVMDSDRFHQVLVDIATIFNQCQSPLKIGAITGDVVNLEADYLGRKVLETPLDVFAGCMNEYRNILGSEIDQTFFVYGNHEHGHTRTDELHRILDDVGGIHVVNGQGGQRFDFGGFQIACSPYYPQNVEWYRDGGLSSLIGELSEDPILWLTHSPEAVDLGGVSRVKNALILAGHTHGGHSNGALSLGQNALYNAALHAVKYNSQYVKGFYELDSNNSVFVSSGGGIHPCLPQTRTTCPEVPIIRLSAA